MIIYPAIDIKDGRAVRLFQGRAQDSTDYGDPIAAALRWQTEGAEYLHMVDLDGAFEGKGRNLDTVAQVVHKLNIPIQLGGGIRTMEDIRIRLEEVGITRVILGTVAASDPDLVARACEKWPGRIVLGMDVKDGFVAVQGWVEKSQATPEAVLPIMREAGVDTVIFTDISRDGMMEGPNVPLTRRIVEISRMNVIGSGGVSSLADISGLKEAGCAGAITGKALYMGAITLSEAMKAAGEER